MTKEKKLSLEDLKVQSFWTTLSGDEQNKAKGGIETDTEAGTTWLKIFC